MKLRKEHRKLLEALILFLVICISIILIKSYFKPFIWIVIIFILSTPLYDLFIMLNINKKISATLTILLLNISILLIIYYLGRNIFNIVNNIYMSNISIINSLVVEFNTMLEGVFGNIDITGEIMNLFRPKMLTVGALTTGEGLVSYFIGNVCTFFILIDREKIIGYIKMIIPRSFIKRISSSEKNVRSIIAIQMVLILISTIIIIIGFMMFRISNPIILGIVCGILDLLPYVGTIIVFIPIIIYNIIVKNYIIAFGLICLYILVQVIREILEAKLMSNKLDIHPLIIFLSIYIGIKVFGMIGIFVGPLYSIMVKDIFCEG